MKKSYNPISDVSNEKSELTRRIYRSLTEVVRQLDDVRGRSQSVSNLFLPSLAPLKTKLHDLCYKLIMTDPLGYGKKGEELLWRKGYHDMFTSAKRLRKNDTWSPEDVINVQGLLMSGIGHYQHFLFQLQTDYRLHFQGIVDFPLNICALGLQKGETSHQKHLDKDIVNWAKEACQRCLIYLGDLNRYLLDIYPLWDSGTAERYYIQAANMNLECGRPYNQLGTLAGSKNYNLDAVYNYVRCMIRSEPFKGTEGNLKKTLAKNAEFMQLEPFLPNPPPSIQKLVMKFLFIFDVWYFEKSVDNDLHNMCHEMLQEFQFCLREENIKSLPLDSNEIEITNVTPFRDRSLEHPGHLTCDMLLKMVILMLTCVDKLKKNDSSQASVAAAMALAMLSQLVQYATEKFQLSFSRCASNGSKKLPLAETQANTPQDEKCMGQNTANKEIDNETNESITKKNLKNLMKKKNKDEDDENLGLPEDLQVKTHYRKKTRLKRRKRIRPLGSQSQDSDLSDSDITLNDSSSEDESYSADSGSEDMVSSESEDLDETLLIIDQKIKEKKVKDDLETHKTEIKNVINSVEEGVNLLMRAYSVTEADGKNDSVKNGMKDRNGVKSAEKDKAKSLFTISNGVREEKRVSENNRGDFNPEDYVTNSNSSNGTISTLVEPEANENTPTGQVTKDIDSGTNICNLREADGKKYLHFLSEQGVIKAIKLYCDWLQTDPEVVKACGKSSKTLLGKLVAFLNLMSFEKELFSKECNKIKIKNDSVPLCEDMITRGLSMFEGAHKKLDWDFHKTNHLSNLQENLIRITRIKEFGHYLCGLEETGISFNNRRNTFFILGQNGTDADATVENLSKIQISNASRKGQLMKNMGQLWLKAEVRDLESRVRRKAGNFSPYLVVDSEALIDHIALVKQLVGSRQFIVIIPTVVLSHLDECKRDSGRARETIRWLESQFQHGNRSLRAQKSQERISLPLIKYPKKKDKEAWNFFQIVECCHYFSKQSEFQSGQSSLLVTLLTGQRDISLIGDSKKDDFGKDYSPVGIAKNFGINLEHIETFHTKWKLSTKSHG